MQAKKAAETASAKAGAKASAKAAAKALKKKYTFDARNIPRAVEWALANDLSDLTPAQKRLLRVEGKTLPEHLHGGYTYNAQMGLNSIDPTWLMALRRMFACATAESGSSSSKPANQAAAEGVPTAKKLKASPAADMTW